ncbi:MAG: metallophosphoesterase [Pedobacter sp.]|nr:MAG: metallophosphoesterase [Pedobacter sp.]
MKLHHALIFSILTFFTFTAKAQEPLKRNTIDGPYLLYKGDSILVASTNSEPSITATKQSTLLKNKNKLVVDVKFSDAPEKNFSLKLKPILTIEPSVWQQPEKILFLSDIEGEFDALRNLLLANGVISKKYEWIFGKGHFVICGDLFDRGKDVPAVLWLLYKLEQDAKAKGGYVHTILGNHDIMNLSGDLRYVDPKYIKSAAAMGYDYMDLYNENTELGKWLRSKNLIEKIGDNICLHGGVSAEINNLGLSVEELNKVARPYIGIKDLKKTVTDSTVLKIFSSDGLFWNRDYFKEQPADEKVIDQTLAIHKIKRIIVGHTITATNVGFYYNGKVLGIDVNQHAGKHEGALYEDKQWFKVNLTGEKIPLK